MSNEHESTGRRFVEASASSFEVAGEKLRSAGHAVGSFLSGATDQLRAHWPHSAPHEPAAAEQARTEQKFEEAKESATQAAQDAVASVKETFEQ